MKTYTYPQETWTEKECVKHARHAPANAYGDKPPKGIIARCGSSYPEYGQTIRFNGGTVKEGKWYEAVAVPLPIIPPSYEFRELTSWGLTIRKKEAPQSS